MEDSRMDNIRTFITALARYLPVGTVWFRWDGERNVWVYRWRADKEWTNEYDVTDFEMMRAPRVDDLARIIAARMAEEYRCHSRKRDGVLNP